ncbi:MAG: hypothetical protein K2P98_03175 [Neisseriaceae bacterium]|nr:hypothetical protein [Neisseriaceae bacterium]
MMDLKIIIVLLGILCILGVIAFNTWQERQVKARINSSFALNEDALLTAKPTQVRDGMQQTQSTENSDADPPMVGTKATPDASLSFIPKQGLPLSELIDYIISLSFEYPKTFTELPSLSANKHICMVGKDSHDSWEEIVHHSPKLYQQINVGLQLLDSNEAITRAQLIAFNNQVEDFALSQQATIHFPDIETKLQQAKRLAEFHEKVDGLIGLNLVFELPLAANELAEILFMQDLTLAKDGAFYAYNAQDEVAFSVINSDNSPFIAVQLPHQNLMGITLLLDVPRIKNGLVAFDRAVGLAFALIETHHGDLVDDNGGLLTINRISCLRDHLIDLYKLMSDQRIEAGSPLALRLFS